MSCQHVAGGPGKVMLVRTALLEVLWTNLKLIYLSNK